MLISSLNTTKDLIVNQIPNTIFAKAYIGGDYFVILAENKYVNIASVIRIIGSTKRADDFLKSAPCKNGVNQLRLEFALDRSYTLIEQCTGIAHEECKGYYIHPLLMPYCATWANNSPAIRSWFNITAYLIAYSTDEININYEHDDELSIKVITDYLIEAPKVLPNYLLVIVHKPNTKQYKVLKTDVNSVNELLDVCNKHGFSIIPLRLHTEDPAALWEKCARLLEGIKNVKVKGDTIICDSQTFEMVKIMIVGSA